MAEGHHKMGFFGALAMAVGGMIGGGIFAVLGLVMMISQDAAFLSFLIGALLAFNAGDSFNKLYLHYRKGGGLYTYTLLGTGNRRLAGFLSWILILGYIFTICLYAFTFSSYAGEFFGYHIGSLEQKAMSIGIIVLFVLINIYGLHIASKTENFLVYGKIALIGFLVYVLLASMGADKVSQGFENAFTFVADKGITPVLAGAAMIFVAYEGFQLITYSASEVEDPAHNIGRAIYGAIFIVMLAYVGVGFVTAQLVPAEQVIANKETVFATMIKPVMGQVGVWIVLVTVIFSTFSAVNATLYGTSRLTAKVASGISLPNILSKKNNSKIPTYSILAVGIVSILIVSLLELEALAAFASIVFILYFAIIDYLDFKVCKQGLPGKIFTLSGTLFSIFAIILLVLDMFDKRIEVLEVVVLLFLGLTILKVAKGIIDEKILARGKARKF